MSRASRRTRLIRSKLPLRTRLFTSLAERVTERQVLEITLENVERIRAFTLPARAPFTWITGRVSPDVDIWETDFPARDGVRRPVRAYRPRGVGPHPVVVYFHGGGFVLGNLINNDPFCAALAEEIPAVVLAVDYRKGPEHRAPQAVFDAVDAVRWAAGAAAEANGDGQRLAVCGDSAGGTLATLSTHLCHDAGGPPIRHQALIYPGTDLTKSFPSIRSRANGPFLTAKMMTAFLDHYLGGDVDPRSPMVSPYWREDLTGLPPALVQTADIDPLRDEGLAYADRLAEAGVAVRATNYLGAVHGFIGFPGVTVAGAQALLELVTELRRHLVPHAGYALD